MDLLDVGIVDLYKNDILTAMRWITAVWNDISETTIRNCWGSTGIVPAYDCDDTVPQLDSSGEDIAAVQQFIEIAVPSAARRIPVEEVLLWESNMECTQVYSDEDIVADIVSAGTQENEVEE